MAKLFCVMCVAALFIVTPSCAGQTGPGSVEQNFGASYRLAVANQTLYPDAGRNAASAEGLDGRAAERTYDQYLKSFDKAQKEPTYLLGVGGPAGAAK